MYVFNFKINGKLIFKIVFVLLLILILIMCFAGITKLFGEREVVTSDCSEFTKDHINVITSSNYANVLKTVHNDLQTYVGIKIKFTGFIYRLYDFSDNQFVLARQMIISPEMHAVIVGFLCDLNGAEKYNDGCWVEATGTITKGNYHGEIPVIEIESIKQVETPSDEYVYPSDENYLPTSVGL